METTNSKTAPIVQEKDLNQVTLDLMRRMRLTGMANAFEESVRGVIVRRHEAHVVATLENLQHLVVAVLPPLGGTGACRHEAGKAVLVPSPRNSLVSWSLPSQAT